MTELSQEEWKKAELMFGELFLKEGYDTETSTALAFFVTQTIQNVEPIYIKMTEKLSGDPKSEFRDAELYEVMVTIHMLFQNYDNIRTGHKMLMYESPD
jgi:hypothetical protein